MSKICEMCGKKPVFGNNVSHAHNKTRRRWNPNLQKVRINDHGRIHTVSICTSCLKKGGFQKVV